MELYTLRPYNYREMELQAKSFKKLGGGGGWGFAGVYISVRPSDFTALDADPNPCPQGGIVEAGYSSLIELCSLLIPRCSMSRSTRYLSIVHVSYHPVNLFRVDIYHSSISLLPVMITVLSYHSYHS